MTDTEVEPAVQETPSGQEEPCMCQSYLRATDIERYRTIVAKLGHRR